MRRSRTLLPVEAVLVAAALQLAAAGDARAQLGITDQQRTLSAASTSYGALWDENANPFFPDLDPPTLSFEENAADVRSAPDFGPFEQTASTVDPFILILAPQGSVQSFQSSTLSPVAIHASSSVGVVAHSRTLTATELSQANAYFQPAVPYDFGTLGDSEGGVSELSVDFVVSEAQPFTLSASVFVSEAEAVGGFELTSAGVVVVLVGPSGAVASVGADQSGVCPGLGACSTGFDSVEVSGVLEPGSYTLTAGANVGAGGSCLEIGSFACHAPTADGSFEVSLATPTGVPALSADARLLVVAAIAILGGFALPRSGPGRRGRSPES